MATRERDALGNDPLWYKDAIIYQLHVRSFCDSNADGIGDFLGLTSKLDYLQDLGVTAIWVMPFYPSPLKDDGYDIGDYYEINPLYGTLADFKTFLDEAHRRRLRVITELVINHTSDQMAWFQKSRRAMARLAAQAPSPVTSPTGASPTTAGKHPDDLYRDFYVWTQDPTRYKEVRIIFKDFEPSNWTWDPLAHAYYWHRFFSHQPDLNFDNPRVHEEILRIIDYWCEMGVDGFRLDAIPYLYEREGTSGESLPETHAFIKKLRAHVDEKYGDRVFLAEANQWPEEMVNYFGQGKGDECHMAFHFPVMPRLFMSVRMEDRVPLVDIIEQTPPLPETSQWAIFLRNHDELTLEMVTDEERDYMYRVYATESKARINLGIRRRLAPLLGNDRNRIELLNMLLLSLPGTPVIYYGDEIGMGDNIYLGDRNGVRTPMHWSSDKNAGFSRASPQALQLPIIVDPEYHYEAVNVETQQRNTNSLLWWMKRIVALRKKWKAFGRGTLQFLHPKNRKVLAFIRRHEDEVMLVVANLSRFPQPVELDLAQFSGMRPREALGRTKFPAISNTPYLLTLSPHAAFWFALEREKQLVAPQNEELPIVTVAKDWREAIEGTARVQFEAALAAFFQHQRWFAGHGKDIESLLLREALPMPGCAGAVLLIVTVNYVASDAEHYCVPVSFASNREAEELQRGIEQRLIARVRGGENGLIFDTTAQQEFGCALIGAVRRGHMLSGHHGQFTTEKTGLLDSIAPDGPGQLTSTHDFSNTTALFGDKLFLKIFRRLEAGENPELEVTRHLTRQGFTHVPELAGALEYRRDGHVATIAVLSRAVPDARSAWSAALDSLGRYFDRIRTLPPDATAPAVSGSLLSLNEITLSEEMSALLGAHGEMMRLLGQRTAEFHIAMANDGENREFTPDPFTPFYQRSLYQSMRNQVVEVLGALNENRDSLPESARALIGDTAAWQRSILARLRAIHAQPMTAQRTRIHGDYHLGQVIYTGKDFYIIDLEGDWARPLSERRIKRSPLRDVVTMVRSFHYAGHTALQRERERGHFEAQGAAQAEQWVRFWARAVSSLFVQAYLNALGGSGLLPDDRHDVEVLFDALLIDRTFTELRYELNGARDTIVIPLRGLVDLLDTPE